MIIVFPIGLRQHSSEIHAHDYYIFWLACGNTHQDDRSYLQLFHLFVWPNHNRPVARWDFSCVVKWPELEWVLKSKHLVCFKPCQITWTRMSLKNQSIWSALNHVKMLSPSQTCSNWDFNQSVWSALNHIKMLSPSQTCSNRGFKWAL